MYTNTCAHTDTCMSTCLHIMHIRLTLPWIHCINIINGVESAIGETLLMIYQGNYNPWKMVGSLEYVCKQYLDALTSLLTPV